MVTSVSNNDSSKSIDFERMIAVHRGASRGYRLYAAGLALAGAILVILAFAGSLPWLPALVTGVIALAVAIIPARHVIERRERIEGLEVLREEWRDLSKDSKNGDENHQRFFALLHKLYARGGATG